MSPCLIEEGSLTLDHDELVLITGFSTQEFEDRIAELVVDACHQAEKRRCQVSEVGAFVITALQELAPEMWDTFESELMKRLVVLSIDIARQIVPFDRRSF